MSFYIMFVAASLSKCSQYWLEIGAPAFIVQWITKGVPLIFKEQPCPFHLNNHVLNEKERTFVQEEIKSLLNCGAIEKCDFIPNLYLILYLISNAPGLDIMRCRRFHA